MKEEKTQLTIDLLQSEITAELESAEPITADEEKHASRKEFRIRDFDAPRDKEMAVFTHAKKLSEYVFVICEKAPKKYRWSVITRMQNASVAVIENLYFANFERNAEQRQLYQKSAAVNLNLLNFYAETAKNYQAITFRQMEILARYISETRALLNGWVKSTRKTAGN